MTPTCGANGCSGTPCGSIRKGVDEWSIWQQYVDCKGAIGQYVWVYLPGQQRSLVFDVKVYRSKPDIPLDRQNTTKVCYGVEAHPQTATDPEFTIVTDPEDPMFYSTCYAREKNITWLGAALTSSAPVGRWRFNEHCLDCATYHHNAQTLDPSAIPAPWKTADGQCANCDHESTPPAIAKTLLPWKLTWKGYCDTDKQTCGPTAPSCLKEVAMGGRSSVEGDDWTQRIMSDVDCQILVERDPECQPIAQYGRQWWDGTRFVEWKRSCMCWRKSACCGKCTPWSWDVPHEGSEIYSVETSVAPNPTCASGIKSSDNKMCCGSYCKGTTGASVCGWSTAQWNCYQGVSGGGGCCENNTVQLCTAGGFPCLL